MNLKYWSFSIVFAFAWASVSSLMANVITLTDGGSRATIDPYSQAGMSSWGFVLPPNNNSFVSLLRQQWFWYRVGATSRERSIDTISAPTLSTPDQRTLAATYATNQFSVRVDYLLTGGVINSGQSDIGETITIQNLSATTLPFHLFQYSHFDLSFGFDTVQLGKNLRGLYNEADQIEGYSILSETVTTPGANRGETAFLGTTLNELNDASPTDLSNANGPVGPGDVTWAFQWDLNIAAGGAVIISKDKYLRIYVPEPSAVSFLALSLAIFFSRRPAKSPVAESGSGHAPV